MKKNGMPCWKKFQPDVWGVLLSGIVQSICPKLREHLYEKEVTKTVDIVIMAVLLFLCTMYLVSSTYNPFIFFRF